MGFNILMVSQRLGHEKVETTWQTYVHLYPDKEKMLAAQLDTVKVRGITANVTIEDQLTEFMSQLRSHMNQQPALIDLNSEQIIRWDPNKTGFFWQYFSCRWNTVGAAPGLISPLSSRQIKYLK